MTINDALREEARQREAERGHQLKRLAGQMRAAMDTPCQCGQMTAGECMWNPSCVLNGGAGR